MNQGKRARLRGHSMPVKEKYTGCSTTFQVCSHDFSGEHVWGRARFDPSAFRHEVISDTDIRGRCLYETAYVAIKTVYAAQNVWFVCRRDESAERFTPIGASRTISQTKRSSRSIGPGRQIISFEAARELLTFLTNEKNRSKVHHKELPSVD
jgi:hypothetical protein